MFSLPGFYRPFIISFVALVVFLLFVRLGFWQIERADEKRQLLISAETFAHQPAITWEPETKNPANYQRLKIQGRFLPTNLLLDNQHNNHRFGYHVLSPLQLANQQVILIDRGWIPGDLSRQVLPKVQPLDSEAALIGRAYYPSTKKIVLGQMTEQKKPDLIIIEWLDIKNISQVLQKPVYPFIIRLDKNQANGYLREWPVVAMPPQRHFAYAVQWFALAILVLILYFVFGFKKRK